MSQREKDFVCDDTGSFNLRESRTRRIFRKSIGRVAGGVNAVKRANLTSGVALSETRDINEEPLLCEALERDD